VIRSSRPYFPKEDIKCILKDVSEVLENGRLRNGKNLQLFEHTLADYVGVKEAVAFDSDGDALETALRYYGIEDKEVVVCTNSFVSMPNSVVYAGGKVVFADIRADTISMDPESLRKCISKKTCGVVITHIAGFPNPDLKEIMEICDEHDLFLIEDATHAIGATFHGRKMGTFGKAGVFAFTPTKVLTSGEGGAMVTNDAKLSENARHFRFYGSGVGKTEFVNLGRHMVLPEISAILGIYQLKRAEEFIDKRNKIADIYDEELEASDYATTIRCAENARCSYYKYPVTLDRKIDKPKFAERLYRKWGVETGNVFYPPCHLQSFYKKGTISVARGGLSTSEDVLARTITLPMHAGMTLRDARHVCKGVLSVLESATKNTLHQPTEV
jgi:dTDP-4-amino-4,6-dideoxygalactose transaminase